MQASQWIALLASLSAIIGVVFLYLRKGAKIRRDDTRRTEDWPNITQGGSS
jgi:hypothetical protein